MKYLQLALASEKVKPLFKELRVGLEKESQRVDAAGHLATTDHPNQIGSRDSHPYIQTDFSETQMELITPVFDTTEETLRFLGALHDVTLRSLDHGERLWPLSMPPVLPEYDRDIMIAKLSDQGDVNYRRYLAKVYGKRKQMVSGIHYNVEFSKEMMTSLFEHQTEYDSLKEMQTALYLKTSRHYLRYRWLITYLFGASPYAETGYFVDGEPKQPVRSIRNSHYGYTNRPEIKVSYESLTSYVSDINDLVDNGDLIEAKEFYSPVRLRGCESPNGLLSKGVCYIELRNIDLNPFASYGITQDTLDFIHLFTMGMLWLEESGDSSETLLETGTTYNERVSMEHPLSKTALYDEGNCLLDHLQEMCEKMSLPSVYRRLIDEARYTLEHPEDTLSGQIVSTEYELNRTNEELGTDLAKVYYDKAFEKPYQLEGYRHMELSTQILLFDALQKGVTVELLDETDQFLKLTCNGRVEYVKNANMTSKDSYIVPLMMENKTVTKKVLAKAGYRVPSGKEYNSKEKAELDYARFAGKGIVVKPKSTNYGLGISIFKDGASFDDYKEALAIAFLEDTDVLVEEYLSGTEYRFFVLNGETLAIMQRTPANVVGDGVQTIQELVEEKNQDALRGTHHRAPLELIQLGDIERLMLKEQGYRTDSIPSKGDCIYLRENSNVSTGGDSIDATDEVHESYKRLAEGAVETLGAKICGIDLIIPDKDLPATKSSQHYGIIEGNFNPAMHMHIYPYEGASRRLTTAVLEYLYPELRKK